MKKSTVILNTVRPPASAKKSTMMEIRNRDDVTKPLEIVIYDLIGKDDYSGGGFSSNDFAEALKGQPENRAIDVRMNSRGGHVNEGIAIYNRLDQWKGMTRAFVDGDASSIASVVIMGCKEIHMPSSANVLIHEAHAVVVAQVNSDELQTLCDELKPQLESASNRIANIYAKRTGKTPEEMRALMRKTTVFNGTQAKAFGLCTVLTDEASLYNFSPEDIENFRQPERTPGNQPTKPPTAATTGENTMNKAKLIAAIQKLGGTVADNATDEQLNAQFDTLLEAKTKTPPPAEPAKPGDVTAKDMLDLRNELATERARVTAEKKTRISAEIDTLIANSQLPGANRESYITRACADETILAEYRSMPSVPPGVEPFTNLEITADDPKQIEKAILKNFGKQPGLSAEQARERGQKRGQIISANMNRLMPLMNANSVSADLKRTVILQQMIRAFAIRCLPLAAFSTVFNGIRLEGTDKVAVPYMPLQTTASTDFVEGTGYTTFVDTNTSVKTITVNKRKFQALRWSSSEFASQPYLLPAANAMLQAEQLGIDVVNDVLSLVTVANFGASVKISPAAAFDSDDVMDLKGVADLANWPAAMRSLVINSAYDVNLLKDSGVKSALNFGDSDPIREGRIVRIGGFDYYADARVPANAENLQGFIVWKSAILFASAPKPPTAEVRSQLSSYEEVIDPESGAAFSYRLWGNPDTDQSREAIECAFGSIPGETAALKRITSA